MQKKEFEALVEAVWSRVEGKLRNDTESRQSMPDVETRYAIWKEAARRIRLAKGVDLRDLALRYPLDEREIFGAVKLILAPARSARGKARQRIYTAPELQDAVVKVLGYSVLASREELGDEPPVECPDDKKFTQPESFCHEKEEQKGDFVCRGKGGVKKDFVCEGTTNKFYCERPGGKESFVCDANPNQADKFDCTKGKDSFYCARRKEEGPFYCIRGEKNFDCADQKKKTTFSCSADKKRDFLCLENYFDKCFPEKEFVCPQEPFECSAQPYQPT